MKYSKDNSDAYTINQDVNNSYKFLIFYTFQTLLNLSKVRGFPATDSQLH